MKYIFLFLLFIASHSTIKSQTAAQLKEYKKLAKDIISRALTEEKGYKLLTELSKIGSRLSGSRGSYESINWAEERMLDLGMDTVWLQECRVPHWVRGEVESLSIIADSNNNRPLAIAALGGSIGTSADGITANVIEVTSFEDLEAHKELVKNKIVFYNFPFDITQVNTFKGYSTAVKYRVYGASRAAKFGALAAIVRSVGTNTDNVPHTGTMRYDENLPKIPTAAIGNLDADYLSSAIAANDSLKLNLKLSCKNLPDTLGYNVIGELKGSELPNEIVLIGGHFDSWDKGIGMHDDGGPCIQTMEAIYLLKQLGIRPKRTIRCVLFANEENGGRGSKKYAEEAVKDSSIYHLAALESDRGVFTPRGFSVTADSAVIETMRNWLPILNECLIDWIRPGGSGADVSKIKNAKALIGFVPDSQRYMDLHHSEKDVLDAVHPREMELGSAAIAILALLISDFGL